MGGCASRPPLNDPNTTIRGMRKVNQKPPVVVDGPPESIHGGGLALVKAETEELLKALQAHPGRVVPTHRGVPEVGNLSKRSGKYWAHTVAGNKGRNQDTYTVVDGLAGTSAVFMGVWDGHGTDGHLVSELSRDALPCHLERCLINNASAHSQGFVKPANVEVVTSGIVTESLSGAGAQQKLSSDADADNVLASSWGSDWRSKVVDACLVVDHALKTNGDFDASFSGATSVSAIIQDDTIVTMSLGDSRCIVMSENLDGTYFANQLSIDYKPDHEEERARINKMGGRVFPHPAELHIARFWLPEIDAPGLAMSRAFGDTVLKPYGLSAEPGMMTRKLTAQDKLVLLYSDGVSDVMTNQDVVDFVGSLPPSENVAAALAEKAMQQWAILYPRAKRDDIAVVAVSLEDLPDLHRSTPCPASPEDAPPQRGFASNGLRPSTSMADFESL
eukprot:jgi/Chlat1/939/Chrsp108S01370